MSWISKYENANPDDEEYHQVYFSTFSGYAKYYAKRCKDYEEWHDLMLDNYFYRPDYYEDFEEIWNNYRNDENETLGT